MLLWLHHPTRSTPLAVYMIPSFRSRRSLAKEAPLRRVESAHSCHINWRSRSLAAGEPGLLHGNQVQSLLVRCSDQETLHHELLAGLKLPGRVRNLWPRELRPLLRLQQFFFGYKLGGAKKLE